MARALNGWAAGTALACAILGLVYLPPGGTPWPAHRSAEIETPNRYRDRERALAQRLRDVEAELRLFEARALLQPELDRRRARATPGPALLVVGPDSLSDGMQQFIASQLDTVWRRLGLGVTKISVGVVLHVDHGRASAPAVRYLLPDSADRISCLVLLPAMYWSRSLRAGTLPTPVGRFRAWVQSGLGPCAYYAAFGSPGGEIAAWMSARGFDLALRPAWHTVRHDGGRPAWPSPVTEPDPGPWSWAAVYRLPPDALGCLAGRDVSCREAILRAAGTSDTVRRFVTNQLWWRRPALPGDDHYLADVLQAIGRERFRRFWNSELPVDTALAAALREPVGAWTRRWEESLAPHVRLGAAAPLPAALLGLLLAFGAIGWVMRTVERREVR